MIVTSEAVRFSYLQEKAKLRSAKLFHNEVRLYNNFESSSGSMILEEKSSFKFSECDFVIDKESKVSIFYYGGKSGTSLELERCTFIGELKNGNYFIDGKLIYENSPKLIVRNCKFLSNSKHALNLKRKFASFDLEKQEKKIEIYSIIVSLIIVTVVVIIATIMKKNNHSYSQDEFEEPFQSHENSENSLANPSI